MGIDYVLVNITTKEFIRGIHNFRVICQKPSSDSLIMHYLMNHNWRTNHVTLIDETNNEIKEFTDVTVKMRKEFSEYQLSMSEVN